jgi:glycosyltransferase involved in cell wall biosynthesis
MTRRIVFIDETSEVGGAEVNLLTIAAHLKKIGWLPAVVVPRDGPVSVLLNKLGIAVYNTPISAFRSSSVYIRRRYRVPNPFALIVNTLLGLLWIIRLYTFLQRFQPAIVHTVSMWSHVFASIAARLAGCPVVWHFQDIVSPYSGFGMYKKLLMLWARHIPSRILCISEAVADQFRADARIRDNVYVLLNTIDVAKFSLSERADNRDNERSFMIGTVARLTPWKGHEVALQAAQILKRRSIRFRWLFAGDDSLGSASYRSYLLKLIHKYGLEQDVEFVGWVADMPTFYRSLDVLVHVPTEPEPFGLVLAEAMATGLPIISTSGGGAESIVEASGGILIAPNQPDAVADALATLLKSPHELIERGKAARTAAETMFSLERYAEQLVGVYTTLSEAR